MFEQSVLDNSRRARSKWTWMGVVIQAGLTAGMLLIPMVSPEILSVMLPKAMIYLPEKPIAPVEVEVQTRSAAARGANSTAVVARPQSRVFTAPSASQPLAGIIDGDFFAPPSVEAKSSLPFAPTGYALPTAPPPKPKEPSETLRVGGQVQAANILIRVNPPYPPLARQARISGAVKLEGIIAKDGTVQRLTVISGHPLLVKAAVDAVTQWRYRPTRLNGEPVEVIAPIEVIFILSN